MTTRTCEVTLTSPIDGGQRDCGAGAVALVNGVPMCVEHDHEWNQDGLTETREALGPAIAHTDGEMVPCGICTKPTRMLGTKRCDGCWELEQRLQFDGARLLADPKTAPQFLALLAGIGVVPAPVAQAQPAVAEPLDEIISVIFREGERAWLSGTTHATEGEADAFARGMLGHRSDDERDGAFTYDSFEVARYRRVRGAGPAASSPPPVASTPPASNKETPPW